ncbi:MAG: hypothetical protein E6Q58_01970, partial [Niabella sp.]
MFQTLKYFFVFLLLIVSKYNVHGQNFISHLETLSTKYSQEKAYLHYDKSTYLPGETIWYKVYTLSELTPSVDSKNFYIDW